MNSKIHCEHNKIRSNRDIQLTKYSEFERIWSLWSKQTNKQTGNWVYWNLSKFGHNLWSDISCKRLTWTMHWCTIAKNISVTQCDVILNSDYWSNGKFNALVMVLRLVNYFLWQFEDVIQKQNEHIPCYPKQHSREKGFPQSIPNLHSMNNRIYETVTFKYIKTPIQIFNVLKVMPHQIA